MRKRRSQTWWEHLQAEHGYVPQQLRGRSVMELRNLHTYAHRNWFPDEQGHALHHGQSHGRKARD